MAFNLNFGNLSSFGLEPIDVKAAAPAPLSQAELVASASRAASSPVLNVSTPTYTVDQLYQALGREADPGGLEFWSGYQGPNLLGSFEAAAKSAGETFDLGRLSAPTDYGPPSSQPSTFETVNITPQVKGALSVVTPTLSNLFGPRSQVSTPSLVSTQTYDPASYGPTYEDLVSGAYQQVLDRPRTAEETFYVDALRAGTLSPQDIYNAIAYGASGSDVEKAQRFLRPTTEPEILPYQSLLSPAEDASGFIETFNEQARDRDFSSVQSWEDIPNVTQEEVQAAQNAGYETPGAYLLAKAQSTDPALAEWRESFRDQVFGDKTFRKEFGDLFAKPIDRDAEENIYKELETQYNLAKEQGGYKYKNEGDLDEIWRSQAAKLAAGGVKSIYEIDVRETPQFETYTDVQKFGNNYYVVTREENTGNEIKTQIDPSKITEIEERAIPVFDSESNRFLDDEIRYDITVEKDPVKELVNKNTGDPVYDVILKGNWREDPNSYRFRGNETVDVEKTSQGYDRISRNLAVRDQADMVFMRTDEGLPVILPAWKSTKSDLTPVALAIAAFAGPYAMQIGGALGATTAATKAMVGAGVISGGTQLALTGKIDPGALAVSVATAGIMQTGGLTGADIAADAAQLAEQGLSAAQITDTLAATGVNTVTANLAGNFAAAGVPVELAPAITAGTTNMGLAGLQSLATDGTLDPDALTMGFVTGAAGGVSEVAVEKIVGTDRIASLSQDLGLTPEQTTSVLTSGLVTGLNAEITGTGNFVDELAQSLVVNGASFATANKIAKELDGVTSDKGRAALVTASKDIVKVAGNAAFDGIDVGTAIENMAPIIIGNAVSAYVRTPEDKVKETEGVKVAGEVTGETLKALADKPLVGEEATEPVTDAEGNTRRTVTGTDNDGNDYSYTIVKDADGNVSYSYQTQDGSFVTSLSRPDLKGTEEVSGAEVTPVKPPSEIGEKALEPAFDKDKALEDISKESSFSDAYSKARDLLGPGETFDWQGKSYSTATAEERPDLVTTKPGDNTQTDTGAAFHSNIGKTYSPEDMRILEMSISDNASKLPPPTSEIDFVAAAATGQEIPVVGDKISKDIAAPFVTALGTLTRGTAGVLDYTRGTLQAIEAIDTTSPLYKGMKDLADSMGKTADFQIGEWALNEEKQFVDKIYAADGMANKAAALAQAIYEHPTAVLTLSGSEIMEEIPSIAAMIATGGTTALARFMSLGAGALLNAMESGGQGYNEAIALGGSHEQAQKASAGSAAVGAVLGTFAEAPLVRNVFKSTSPVTTAVKREAVTEFPEEFAQTGMVDYFGTGKFDMNNALTAATIAVPVAGSTTGTIGVAVNIDRTSEAAEMVISANNPENAAEISSEVTSILGSSDNIQDASRSIATSLESMGMTNGAATAVANTVAAEQVINNINQSLPEGSKFQVSDLNTVVGVSSEGTPVTVGEYIGSSVTDLGPSIFVQPDIAIGTKTDGSVMTVGDISGSITMNSAPNLEVTQDTNPDTGVTTKTEVNTDNNTTTITKTNPDTNVNTNTVINPDTNTQVDVNVDNNTVVATETNTDTNVQTNITTNVDTLIEELMASGLPEDEAIKEAVKQTTEAAKRGMTFGGGAPMFTGPYDESDFEHGSLFTKGKPKAFESVLSPYLSRVQQPTGTESVPTPTERPEMSADYFIYGKPTEIDEILGVPSNEIPELGMPQFGMRKGGLVPAFADGGPLTMAAGKLRRDYREGDAVEGPGDGQSDDIPAMLADGEFVIPADVVAALGNGSNKAGADKLYEMMHNIRRDYRKAKPKDLPKPAKSPLSYISRRT